MNNNQIKFLAASIILGCSILAIATGSTGDGSAALPGLIGVVLAACIGLTAWVKLGSSKDK